jgi:hypothetical protein
MLIRFVVGGTVEHIRQRVIERQSIERWFVVTVLRDWFCVAMGVGLGRR